jgi:hypothetical protein
MTQTRTDQLEKSVNHVYKSVMHYLTTHPFADEKRSNYLSRLIASYGIDFILLVKTKAENKKIQLQFRFHQTWRISNPTLNATFKHEMSLCVDFQHGCAALPQSHDDISHRSRADEHINCQASVMMV